MNDYHSISYPFDNYYTKFIGKVLNYKKTTEIQCIKVKFGLDVSQTTGGYWYFTTIAITSYIRKNRLSVSFIRRQLESNIDITTSFTAAYVNDDVDGSVYDDDLPTLVVSVN